MDRDSKSLRHLPSGGEEFEAERRKDLAGGIEKKGAHKKREDFQFTGEDGGFVSTCPFKDANKLGETLKHKQSTESQEATVQAKANLEVALLIKPQWCRKIFEKGKIWEIRGQPCNKRTRFAIAASTTGMLVGEATLINCLKVGKINKNTGKLMPWSNRHKHKKEFIGQRCNLKKHQIADLGTVTYSKVYAWVLDNVVQYKKPLPYKHPQGAIKWVKLCQGYLYAVQKTFCFLVVPPPPLMSASNFFHRTSSITPHPKCYH